MGTRSGDAYDRMIAAQTEPLAKTAQEVLDKCIEAMGGRERLAGIITMKMVTDGLDAWLIKDGQMANLYFDYRAVYGVKLPHMKVRIAQVIKTPHIALLSYEINPDLEDNLFVQ